MDEAQTVSSTEDNVATILGVDNDATTQVKEGTITQQNQLATTETDRVVTTETKKKVFTALDDVGITTGAVHDVVLEITVDALTEENQVTSTNQVVATNAVP